MKKNLIVFVLILLVASLFSLCWEKWSRWDVNKVYNEYYSAVWLVHTKWGYRMMVDGEDHTRDFFILNGNEAQNSISSFEISDDGSTTINGGLFDGSATAFFVREDGMLATNKHVLCPWLYDSGPDNLARLEENIRMFYTKKACGTDTLYLHIAQNLKVVGSVDSIWIIPNGKADAPENRVECKLLKAEVPYTLFFYEMVDPVSTHDGEDATIFQTVSETLPASVKRVIDTFEEWHERGFWDGSEFLLSRIGEVVYSIGYPYGYNSPATKITMPALSDVISSQIQNGIITQYRDEYSFGHNIPVANGMSGAPIINDKGHLVGIHTSGFTGTTGVQGINQGVSAMFITWDLDEWDRRTKRTK